MKVGMSPSGYGDPCDGMAWRRYFMFNTAAVQGTQFHVHTVKFNVFETWAASCTAKPVDLYVTGQATSSMTWPVRRGVRRGPRRCCWSRPSRMVGVRPAGRVGCHSILAVKTT